ncbi:MAG: NYN domain-containing protein [Candidatus Heimdallarchaeaceae archaeon]
MSENEKEKSLKERITERLGNISYVQALKQLLSGESKVALFVDGPNILRRIGEKQIKLEDIEETIKELGKPVIKKVILNEHASTNLIQAITNSGYEPIVTPYDIYLTLATEIMKSVAQNKNVGTVVIASRHARIAPILLKMKERGIETAIVGFEPGLSVAITKIADHTFLLPSET